MANLNADEIKEANIKSMGPELGAQFSELWQRVVRAHVYWEEFIELFGMNQARLDLMNETAPAFFNMLQNEMSDAIVLHLTRLTDKSEMGGRKNLTVRNLSGFITEEPTRAAISNLADAATEKTESCRNARNRRIAHDDLGLALNDKKAEPLDNPTKKEIDQALEAIAAVMQAVEMHFSKSELMFGGLGSRVHGAVDLLYVIRDGVKARDEKINRMRSGKGTPDDFKHDEI